MVANNSGGAFIDDIQYFTGAPASLSTRNCSLLERGDAQRRHLRTHGVLQAEEPGVSAYTGFRTRPYAEDYPPNYTQAEGAQKQGGAVTYVHPAVADFDGLGGAGARELPVDLALGQVTPWT